LAIAPNSNSLDQDLFRLSASERNPCVAQADDDGTMAKVLDHPNPSAGRKAQTRQTTQEMPPTLQSSDLDPTAAVDAAQADPLLCHHL
jgi:hypothetical protein